MFDFRFWPEIVNKAPLKKQVMKKLKHKLYSIYKQIIKNIFIKDII